MPRPPVFTFRPGEGYSRRFISAQLGGSLHLYLPTCGGVVVCGCFDERPELNPGAPSKVLLGPGPIVEENAHLVASQRAAIPVFMRRSDADWLYRGRWRCTGLDTHPASLSAAMAAHPARGRINGILTFEWVGN